MPRPIHLDNHLPFWPFPRGRSNMAARAGDARRNQGDWAGAVPLYREALRICPSRRPIWVQLGHALKETGRPEEALQAYARASALAGSDGDAPLHHGILARRLGQMARARAAFMQSLAENPDQADARRELLYLLLHPLAVSEEAAAQAARLADGESLRLAAAPPLPSPQIVYDASDLVSYFHHSRLPTGIQRVQMEVITSALRADPRTQICCFAEESGRLMRIPAAHFEQVCQLAIESGDSCAKEWLGAMDTLNATIRRGAPVDFAQGCFLVNLGTSWWLQNYFLHVRAAQRRFGLRYVPFVHDLIPVMTPQHCVRALTQDFLSWSFGVFDHADHFLVNSRSTGEDLRKVAAKLGHRMDRQQVCVIPLDADFRKAGLTPLPEAHLAQWDLEPGQFVLFVSTIESRKNHVMAFEAWLALIERMGAQHAPVLVCVGNRGWLNDRVYAMLDRHPQLAQKVRMLSRLSDAELALLYSQCRFTLYPSSYEGWGLPVTESLCYGKVPVLTRASSLPEAGGDLAVYIEPATRLTLADAVEQLWCDEAWRLGLEQKIAREFAPRPWQAIAAQVQDTLASLAAGPAAEQVAPELTPITPDRLYRFSRNQSTRLVRDTARGDLLREGTNWWEQEDWGCWTRQGGAELAFRAPARAERLRLHLQLRRPSQQPSKVTIRSGSAEHAFTLEADQQWISVPVNALDGKVAVVLEGDEVVDNSLRSHFRDIREVCVGLCAIVVTSGAAPLSPAAISRRIAASDIGAYGFLRDTAQLMTGHPLAPDMIEDFLPALETGAMSRDEVIAILDHAHRPALTALQENGTWTEMNLA
ncbi:MAG TPA: glycosyltransferase [Novosphingobium sp.]|nr:glycosyltransferase [Novosphingobium sp.]